MAAKTRNVPQITRTASFMMPSDSWSSPRAPKATKSGEPWHWEHDGLLEEDCVVLNACKVNPCAASER